VERLEAAINMTLDAAREVGLHGCSFGHAGDGNLHSTFMIDPANPAEIAAAERGMERVFAGALALGGTVSGEHGLGWLKRGQFALQFRGADAEIQSAVKSLLDPRNLLNPGKKVPPADSQSVQPPAQGG
jgi:FAD/FMN-containing dehydrogenase